MNLKKYKPIFSLLSNRRESKQIHILFYYLNNYLNHYLNIVTYKNIHIGTVDYSGVHFISVPFTVVYSEVRCCPVVYNGVQ